MANPYLAIVNTYNGWANLTTQSASMTFSFAMTAGFEAWVPVALYTTAQLSLGASVTVYRSTDNGGTWETIGSAAAAFEGATAAAAAKTQRRDINLGPGVYLVSVLAGTQAVSTAPVTARLGTAQIITAYA